jgi:Domain of unknown function (DUF4349)
MQTKPRLAFLIIIIILAGAVLSACASRAAPPAAPNMAPEMEMPMEAGAPVRDVAGSSYNTSVPQANPDRMVIKNANMTIIVPDPTTSMDRISQLAEEMGGFVVSAALTQTSLANGKEVPNASVTIRVPAARFNEALERIHSESDQPPQNENINSQDVTSEYTDLESRLRNLEAAEAQLTEIMGSATKTEDVLSVYNELVKVREQIEVIKGQMKYYEQSVALSSISTELVANEAVQPITIGGWQPGAAVRRAIQTLVNTLQGLVNVVIWLVIYLLPVLLALFIIFGLPIILLIWGIRTWRRRRRSKQAVEAEKTGS